MPNSCEAPEASFCASALAKAVKTEDSNAFSLIHDAIGKIFDAETLKGVEEQARNFSELPLHIIDRKLDWLKGLGIEPIDVNAVFTDKAASVVANHDRAVCPEKLAQECIPPNNEDKPSSKKRAKKSKRKRNQTEASGNLAIEEAEKSKNTTKVSDIVESDKSISAIIAEIEKIGEPSGGGKRKKKKKKKESKVPHKDTVEKALVKNKPNTPESTDLKSPVTMPMFDPGADCKSPVDIPMFDSGIGSCVASGGEDKSSILSGGTIESIGESAELSPPVCYNFEADGNSTVIRDYLNKNESVFFEKPSTGHTSGTLSGSESPNLVEFSFGTLNLLPSVEMHADKKVQKKRQNKSTTKNILNTKKNIHFGLGCGEFEISFKLPTVENTPPDQGVKTTVKSFPRFKDIDVEGDFDHVSAVQFLTDEWNKTLKNPMLYWCP